MGDTREIGGANLESNQSNGRDGEHILDDEENRIERMKQEAFMEGYAYAIKVLTENIVNKKGSQF